jgi:amidase/aspartyl-tRNA(Asn)/glutamyl-tRNA(Gln) amidotransferase subunit A
MGRSIEGMRVGYTPDYDIFPIDPRVASVARAAAAAFEEAGAHVDEVSLGITRDQRELSDLWCRLIIPINLQAFEVLKDNGLNVLEDHRDDLPPEYLRWIDAGYQMSALDFVRDQEIRTEIYDAIQGVFADYDLIIGPTLACLPVDNADDGNTAGPTEINGVEVDPLIGWCPTYLFNYTGHPAASIPAGMSDEGLPVGLQIVGRRLADADVFAASAAFERARPWFGTYARLEDRPL